MSYGSDTWEKWILNEEQALPLLKAAWDAGIQTWDTANVYSNVLFSLHTCKTIRTDHQGYLGGIDCKSNQKIQYSKGETGYLDEMFFPDCR